MTEDKFYKELSNVYKQTDITMKLLPRLIEYLYNSIVEYKDACDNRKYDSWIYVHHEENMAKDKKRIYWRIDKYKDDALELAVYHKDLALEISAVFDRIRVNIEKENIDLNELLECKNIIENRLSDIIGVYRSKVRENERNIELDEFSTTLWF